MKKETKFFIGFEGHSKNGYDYAILKTNNYNLNQHEDYRTKIGLCDKFFNTIDEAINYINKFQNQTHYVIEDLI